MKVETEPSTSCFNKFDTEKGDIKDEEDKFLEELDSMIDEAKVTDQPTFWLLTVIKCQKLTSLVAEQPLDILVSS